jgi:hypothetical protein
MIAQNSFRSRVVLLSIAVVVAMATSAGCDKDAEASPEAAKSAPSKKDGEAKADQAAPEDCSTFAKELQTACSDIMDKRLNLPCSEGLLRLDAIRERDGVRFSGDEAVDEKAESGVCRMAILKLREGRAKVEGQSGDGVTWHEACPAFFETLKTHCVEKIATATHEAHCQHTMRVVEVAVQTKSDGGMGCVAGPAQIEQLQAKE